MKINARIQCHRVSTNLFLQVTLWKTGLFYPHKVKGPTTSTEAKGNRINNLQTYEKCKNNTSTTFYGTAYGRVEFQGRTYAISGQSGNNTLDCGT